MAEDGNAGSMRSRALQRDDPNFAAGHSLERLRHRRPLVLPAALGGCQSWGDLSAKALSSIERGCAMSTSLPLDHSGLGVLSNEECLRRLRAARVGRVAFVERGEPVILPVNHGLDGEAVVFLTAPGSKLVAADNELPVAFEVDGYDADRRAGWSVVIRGTATTVDDQSDVARLNLIGVSPWADLAERTHWVRITAYSLTGREVVHPAR